jgi:L-alanine-DL-glutamate epimerase-like enolase superfamily enzyme
LRILGVRETTAPLRSSLRNAFIDFSQMTTSVVAVVTDVVRGGRRVIGYGFNSNGRYAVGGLLRDRFIARILRAEPDRLLTEAGDNLDPHRIWAVMMAGEKPGGHGDRSVAVGAIDMALWDAVAKIEEKPLFRVLAERYNGGRADERAFVYAAGGYYQPGKDLDALRDEMKGYLDLGYTVVKMKIGGAALAEDLRRVEAVVGCVGDGSHLAVDANGRFDLETALAYGQAIAPYRLRWYEEAGDPLDYQLQASLADAYPHPLATGENLFSHQDARNLVRYGGMRPDRDVLQFDPALSYGLVEYLRTIEMLEEHGWSRRRLIPHGGHLFAVHIALGLGTGGNESYPGVFEPFGGFPETIRVEDGHVRLPDTPGIGYEAKADLHAVLRSVAE